MLYGVRHRLSKYRLYRFGKLSLSIILINKTDIRQQGIAVIAMRSIVDEVLKHDHAESITGLIKRKRLDSYVLTEHNEAK